MKIETLKKEVKMKYGIRYFSNRKCTTGTPHPITGRMSIACEIVSFKTKTELDEWLLNEKLSAPCGCDGGERIPATKKMCRQHCLGMSIEDFETELEYSLQSQN